MKEIAVQLFGAFTELDRQREISVRVNGEHIADLRRAMREQLQQQFPQFRAGLVDYSVFADEKRVLRDSELLPADGRVAILPPVSGG
ncbi:MAG: MoaD/ThiS family protein [Stenotrophomonas sp.]|uniref:MoaD/ThiS family protein n=1 Tax=Stenotrophomonas sp. TaxID=69392 RepID=UPI0028AA81D4|nr:MoaD/ThiS family protein [Stenotrophomonas sp.]